MRKVWKIDNNLGMTIAGAVGDAQELIRVLKAQNEIYKMNENRSMSPKSASSLLSIILQQNKMMPFYVELIVAGMDGDEPQVYSLDPIGGIHERIEILFDRQRVADGSRLLGGDVQEGHDDQGCDKGRRQGALDSDEEGLRHGQRHDNRLDNEERVH